MSFGWEGWQQQGRSVREDLERPTLPNRIQHIMPQDVARLLRIADRLAEMEHGSAEADAEIHHVLGLSGLLLDYTTNDDAAHSLLPAGFEWRPPVYSAGAIYAECRHAGMDVDLPYLHTGLWGRTLALAMCGAAIRGHVLHAS